MKTKLKAKEKTCRRCRHYEQNSCTWLPAEDIPKAWEYEMPPYAEPYWYGCRAWNRRAKKGRP
jgi:hypothetical protein